jgi:hypothetical protein
MNLGRQSQAAPPWFLLAWPLSLEPASWSAVLARPTPAWHQVRHNHSHSKQNEPQAPHWTLNEPLPKDQRGPSRTI